MIRILHVAVREYVATAFTRAFLFGVFVLPVVILGIAFGTKALMGDGPAVNGTVLLVDKTPGQSVAPLIEERFSDETRSAESKAKAEAMRKLMKDKAKELNLPEQATEAMNNPMAQAAIDNALRGPRLVVERLSPDTDLEQQKARLRPSASKESGDKLPPIALVVIPAGAVTPSASGDFSTFELFTVPKLDIQIQQDLNSAAGQSVVDARLATSDLKDQAERIRKVLSQPRATIKSVTEKGEAGSSGEIGMLMPMAFMMLLWISTFTAGQYLLTTTIEEKSNRVMEVILSAVSPMQLMTGKIIGQMGVGLTLLLVYAGAGVGSLANFQLLHLIDWTNLALLVVFFIIAFFLIASLMAAIGSAVSDLREAQALMTPVMMVLMIPLMLWLPISRNPNGPFATICSFLPPISPFVMVIRIPAAAGSTPVPVWQVALSIAIGIASVIFAVWAASKIFRVGVLMYGKPPNFRTLLRWIRMA